MKVRMFVSATVALMMALGMAAVIVVNYPGSVPGGLIDGPSGGDDDTSGSTTGPILVAPSTIAPVGPGESSGPDGSDGCGGSDEELPVDDGCEENEGACDDPCEDPCDDPCDPCEPCSPCDPCEPCDPCDECGCTYTIGYWKNHAGLGHGNQADEVTPLIAAAGGSIWLGDEDGDKSVEINDAVEAKTYLDRLGESSNGINRLYSQLLAAKLNIVNGASDNAIEDTIDAADAFLAEHGSADWSGLSAGEREDVNQWKDLLDDYNEGLIGPGHCG